MQLAAFDLDNTLLAGDSDYLWGQFLVREGWVDGDHYARENQRFYAEYQAGTLDIHAFAAFSLGQMGQIPADTLDDLRRRFVRDVVASHIAPGAPALLDQHRAEGHHLLIITATNSFITRPIADLFAVEHLLGTDPEMRDGRMTGRIAGTPCFQAGKITRLQAWLGNREIHESWCYSDSINDAPLLEWAHHPHAVDPCPRLRALAEQRAWPIITLRTPAPRPLPRTSGTAPA